VEDLLVRSLTLLVAVTLSLGISACASAGKDTGSSGGHTSTAHNATHATGTAIAPSGDRVLDDGDTDNPNDIDGDEYSRDHDDDSDGRTPGSYGYPDLDDEAILGYGHAAGTATRRAITAAITSYYTAARIGAGAKACPLIISSLADSVVEDYGHGSAGPSYLSEGKSCPATMSLLFGHFHSELAGPIRVAAVRLDGRQAEVVLVSKTMPASYMTMDREGSAWKVQRLLGTALP
jgi:hypothetical protein